MENYCKLYGFQQYELSGPNDGFRIWLLYNHGKPSNTQFAIENKDSRGLLYDVVSCDLEVKLELLPEEKLIFRVENKDEIVMRGKQIAQFIDDLCNNRRPIEEKI